MRIGPALVVLLAYAVSQARAQAPAPLVRTTIDPPGAVVIGQPVRLDVTVLFPGDMPHPPLVSIPEAAGAQILRFETQATTTWDRIDGQDYVGQIFEFVLFPRRGGEIMVPAPQVTVIDRAGEPLGTVTAQPQRVSVTVPPGIDPSGPVLAADRVRATQDWTPDPTTSRFKPGDAVIRRIERRADGVPALAMAEFTFFAPDGVRVYVDPPVVDDRAARGVVNGHRTDTVTYVFEREGAFQLPALEQPWWGLADRQAHIEALAGISVTVAAPVSADRYRLDTRSTLRNLLLLAGMVGFVLLLVMAARAWRTRRIQERDSSSFVHRQLVKAARSGDPAATYRAERLWRSRLHPAETADLDADVAYASLHQQLLNAIFAGTADWSRKDGRAFGDVLSRWRPRARRIPRADPLPPLNPPAELAYVERHKGGLPWGG